MAAQAVARCRVGMPHADRLTRQQQRDRMPQQVERGGRAARLRDPAQLLRSILAPYPALGRLSPAVTRHERTHSPDDETIALLVRMKPARDRGKGRMAIYGR